MEGVITIDDFKKVEIRIGEIKSAEKVEGADKLLRLVVSFGLKPSTSEGSTDHPEDGVGTEEIRQVVSGIAEYFPEPSELVGKKCPFATNLEPRTIRGLESQAMILATGGDGETPFALFETTGTPGARVR